MDQARQHVDGWRWAAFAGALAGFGYLARSAGVVAIVAGPPGLSVWKKRREALAFFLGNDPDGCGLDGLGPDSSVVGHGFRQSL